MTSTPLSNRACRRRPLPGTHSHIVSHCASAHSLALRGLRGSLCVAAGASRHVALAARARGLRGSLCVEARASSRVEAFFVCTFRTAGAFRSALALQQRRLRLVVTGAGPAERAAARAWRGNRSDRDIHGAISADRTPDAVEPIQPRGRKKEREKERERLTAMRPSARWPSAAESDECIECGGPQLLRMTNVSSAMAPLLLTATHVSSVVARSV